MTTLWNEFYCDLHTHTTCSDGVLKPAELVQAAKNQKLRCVAITDHDTVAGVKEAKQAGEQIGVEVIPGIEISVIFEPGTMHILGYFVDPDSSALQTLIHEVQQARNERNLSVIKQLNLLGMDISFEEVLKEAGGGQMGRPHFAKVLIQKGLVKDRDQAFRQLLGKGAPAYVNKRKITPAQAMGVIKESGGLAVLAHPIQLGIKPNSEEFRNLISQLKQDGLSGIEAYSSCHTQKQAKLFKKIAIEMELLVTGGSDFHGTNYGAELGNMGDGFCITDDVVSRMKEVLKKQTV